MFILDLLLTTCQLSINLLSDLTIPLVSTSEGRKFYTNLFRLNLKKYFKPYADSESDCVEHSWMTGSSEVPSKAKSVGHWSQVSTPANRKEMEGKACIWYRQNSREGSGI